MSWAFRDWRGGHQSIAIDLALFDLLATVQTLASLLQNRPIRIDLTSGFRTPERNRTIEGAAVHSQHIIGRAADIRLAGLSIADVAEIAETAKAPGLGRYGAFIHLDVGKPGRRWTG